MKRPERTKDVVTPGAQSALFYRLTAECGLPIGVSNPCILRFELLPFLLTFSLCFQAEEITRVRYSFTSRLPTDRIEILEASAWESHIPCKP